MTGPTLIFDKSALQGLSADESMWLENFFITNITPLFFVETLADLEKEVRLGRTPEDIVGSIAHKTPDMGCVNVHHRSLIASELMNKAKIEMSGRPVISYGEYVELGGKTGVIFQEPPEVEAAHRWEKKQFLEIERNEAKEWRQELSEMKEENYEGFQKMFDLVGKPKTFQELKEKVDGIVDMIKEKAPFVAWMSQMGLLPTAQEKILKEWEKDGCKPIREYAPYFSYVLSIDLFYYMGTAAKLFEAFRHPATHKVDIAYLYYLPFCNIFTSSDKIHIALAPIFMRTDQTFISGTDLKSDFSKLDSHYETLPDEVKNRGSVVFAPCPPDDLSFLTTQLWDKYMSESWRNIKDHIRKFDGTDKINPEAEKAVSEEIKKFVKEGKPIDSSDTFDSDAGDTMILRHMVSTTKGKWKKFPPEVLNSDKRIFD
ncbi:MAG: hypothetical protein V4665_03275 [Patescibacteria group bacterium]